MIARVGDNEAGFSVNIDPSGNTVEVRAWGFWSVTVAAQFGDTVSQACLSCAKGATLVMEMSDLKPMRDEGQDSFEQLMKSLPRLGLSKTLITTTNQLTKLQLLRLVSQSGVKNLVQFG